MEKYQSLVWTIYNTIINKNKSGEIFKQTIDTRPGQPISSEESAQSEVPSHFQCFSMQ